MYLLCIYKKPIILSLFKIDTLNFTMYILTILTRPLKTYVIRLLNLISMIIVFLYNYKEKAENKLNKTFKNSFKPVSINIFFTIKDGSFPL